MSILMMTMSVLEEITANLTRGNRQLLLLSHPSISKASHSPMDLAPFYSTSRMLDFSLKNVFSLNLPPNEIKYTPPLILHQALLVFEAGPVICVERLGSWLTLVQLRYLPLWMLGRKSTLVRTQFSSKCDRLCGCLGRCISKTRRWLQGRQ